MRRRSRTSDTLRSVSISATDGLDVELRLATRVSAVCASSMVRQAASVEAMMSLATRRAWAGTLVGDRVRAESVMWVRA